MIECAFPTLETISYIVTHLRERDREEISATAYDKTLSKVAAMAMEAPGHKQAFLLDGEPVFVAGLIPAGDQCVQAWGFGTDKAHRAMLTATRYSRKVISKLVKAGEVNRIQAMCLESVAPIEWLRAIGLHYSIPIGPMGSEGKPFILQYGVFQ